MKAPALHEKLILKRLGVGLGLPDPDPTARALIAVSGGRDSIALLHLLLAAGYRHLTLCHLNHGLRGAESDGDAAFVRAHAATLGLPLEEATIDAAALARESRESLETAARHARTRFFAEVGERLGIETLFLGHHADDQAETVLFNLLRGAGRAGLSGMAALSQKIVVLQQPERSVTLRLHRPMLGLWRSEIDAYIAHEQLPYRDDASNATLDYTRNRIRLSLLPTITKLLGRDPRAALWRTADLLRHEEEWLESLTLLDPAQWEREALPTPELKALCIAEQRRVLQRWLAHHGVPNIGYNEVEAVRSLLESKNAPSKVNLPGCWHARRREKRLFLERSGS